MPPKEGFTPEQIDSLNKVKVDFVVIDTLINSTASNSNLPEQHKDFQPIVKDISQLPQKTIASNQIKSNKVLNLRFNDSIPDAQKIGISKIAFNSDRTQAALHCGYSMGKLNGIVVLYLMKKRNESWEVMYERVIERS